MSVPFGTTKQILPSVWARLGMTVCFVLATALLVSGLAHNTAGALPGSHAFVTEAVGH